MQPYTFSEAQQMPANDVEAALELKNILLKIRDAKAGLRAGDNRRK